MDNGVIRSQFCFRVIGDLKNSVTSADSLRANFEPARQAHLPQVHFQLIQYHLEVRLALVTEIMGALPQAELGRNIQQLQSPIENQLFSQFGKLEMKPYAGKLFILLP